MEYSVTVFVSIRFSFVLAITCPFVSHNINSKLLFSSNIFVRDLERFFKSKSTDIAPKHSPFFLIP